MTRRPQQALFRVQLMGILLACLALVASCTGGSSGDELSEPGAVPKPPRESPTQVEVCDLLSPLDIELLVGRRLKVVGTGYSAARVPTFRCELGRTFATPLLTVELATGPIAQQVFEKAYGAGSGGDPVLVRRIGAPAFARSETGTRVIHAFVSGSILSVAASSTVARPMNRVEVAGLARLAIDRVPDNPVLATTTAGARCSRIDTGPLTAAVGAPPTLASHFDGPRESLMCSWSSTPGSAMVTMRDSPQALLSFRAGLDQTAYLSEDDIATSNRTTQVLSRSDEAGDLVMISPPARITFVSVIPTAGFSDTAIDTTPGERELARAVLTSLG